MDTQLAGKTVLITGGASGIGLAAARAFASEGSRLALVDINDAALREVESELSAGGAEVAVYAADLSTREGVEQGVDGVLAKLDGTLDVLVNNVGIGEAKSFDELSDEDWERTLQVNFYGYLHTIRRVLPELRQRGGAIVNNASDVARQPEPSFTDYSVSKAAVLVLTKTLARTEAPKIRVNAVAPGPVWTPLWSRPGGLADTLAQIHDMEPRAAVDHEMSLRQMPMARLGEAEEVANVIVFLASGLASFVTGSVYPVDGGTVRSLL
jgi:NAD(P)-dependent dehydrogenase (short-subunit alcohol dehydrogenase family)